MRRGVYLFTIIISILHLTSVNALQIKAAKDNETLFFKISEKEYSRIFVTGDRILSVKGRGNLYETKEFKGKNDEGALYIRPTTFYQKQPFSLFLTTEQGHHFTLFITALDVPSENIEIKPISALKSVATHWETNLPYTQEMIELMKDMVSDKQPDGYAVINMGKVKPKKIFNGLTMQLTTIYRGGLLQGEVWKLKNTSGHTLYLHPRDFYQDNVRAASIIDETLKNCDETLLYRIVSHE